MTIALEPLKLLDVVTLKDDLPNRNLHQGEEGTIVEILAPQVYEVEFCDDEGQSYATLALCAEQLMKVPEK
jgi:hypothetical protein